VLVFGSHFKSAYDKSICKCAPLNTAAYGSAICKSSGQLEAGMMLGKFTKLLPPVGATKKSKYRRIKLYFAAGFTHLLGENISQHLKWEEPLPMLT